MTSKDQPIILTSGELEQTENDCACMAQHQVLANQKSSRSFIDDDCACIPSIYTYSEESVGYEWERAPRLYRCTLPNNYQLVFNPFGQKSMAVLNKSASQLLDAFDKPIKAEDFPIHFPHLQTDEINIATEKLLAQGLLIPIQEHSIPVKPFSQTLTVWLHVTNACNLHCDYCYLHKTTEDLELECGKKAIDVIFRAAELHGFEHVKIKYAGGEPTLHFGLILELHDHAKSLASQRMIGLSGVILSNGVSISEHMLQELTKRGLHLSISLDGIGSNHDLHRKLANGHGTFSLVEHSLNLMKANHFKPSITITISNRNLHGLPIVVEYVLKHEIPFTINFYRENHCSAAFSDLTFDDDELINVMKATFKIIEENLPPFSLLGILSDRARLDFSHEKPCGVGSSYMVIDQNGKVSKCHMEIEKSISNISSSDPLKEIQVSELGVQNLSVNEKEGCRDCTWRYWCAGGCPLLTHNFTGRYDTKSPNCKIYSALLPEILRLEGLRLIKNAA